MTDTVTTVLSLGAMFLQVLLGILLLLALGALVSRGGRRLLADVADALAPAALWIAFALAALATGGSLFYSEYSDFIPCRLCWFQRIAMYPLVVILLGAAVRRDVRGAFLYGGPLAVIGALIASYHIYIEYNPEDESPSCKIGAPCATKWIDEYGYITIPVLAITVFVAVAALLVIAWRRRDPAPPVEPAP